MRVGLRTQSAIKKTSAAQAFSAMLRFMDARFAHAVRIAANARCAVVVERAQCAPRSSRQHFLKRDAVFSNVLVYSGCSAFRFSNARSELKPSHYIRRATWPRKLRRRRRRRAQ